MSTPVAIALGILVNCVWGLAFLVPHLLQAVDPVLITIGRYLCYGAISLALFLTMPGLDLRKMTRADWKVAAALALTGNVGYYALVVFAVQTGGVPIAALVIGTLPVTIAVVGNFLQREYAFGVLAPAIVLILSGLFLLNGTRIFGAQIFGSDDATSAAQTAIGFGAALCALALWTWYGIRNAQYMKNNLHVGPNAWSVAIGLATGAMSLALLPILLVAHLTVPAVSLAVFDDRAMLVQFLIASLVLGIVVSWLATIVWNRVARALPVALAGQLIVFETLASLAFVFVADWRLPDFVEVASAVLILTGVIIGIRATLRAARVPATA
jgi:drug/metabolite transporter (DMT)-like permease